jgi:hypothetical protein
MFKKLFLLLILTVAAIGLRIGYDNLTFSDCEADSSSIPEAAVAASKDLPAPTLASADQAPTFVVEQTALDAHELLKGDVHHFVFPVKNTGIGKLEIVVRPTCGCTLAKYDRFIEPGKTGKVEAELRTSSLQGKVQKRLTVETNDPKKPKVDLLIAATIQPVVEVVPIGSPQVALSFNQTTSKDYQVKLHDRTPVEIKSISCSVPYATVQYREGEAPAERGNLFPNTATKNYLIQLTIAKNAPAGQSEFALTLQTTSTREPTTAVRIFCEKGIITLPPAITFNSQQASAERIVTLSKRNGSFHIKRVSSPDSQFQIVQEEMTTKVGTTFRLRIKKSGTQSDLIASQLKVETDDPDQSFLEIPIAVINQQLPALANTEYQPY